MIFTPENALLVGAVIWFVSILLSKTGYKFGVPVLLVFLLIGMLLGVDGLGTPEFWPGEFHRLYGQSMGSQSRTCQSNFHFHVVSAHCLVVWGNPSPYIHTYMLELGAQDL